MKKIVTGRGGFDLWKETIHLENRRNDAHFRAGSLHFQGIITLEEYNRLKDMFESKDSELLSLAEAIIAEKSKQMKV